MRIWQRGTSFSGTVYTADRWVYNYGTSPTATQSTDVPSTAFQYSLSWSGSGYATISQRIESKNCFDLVGQTITISYWAKQTAGGGFGVSVYSATAVDNFSSLNTLSIPTVTNPTSTWAYYTVTIPASAMTSSVANGISISFNQGVSSSTSLITGVQVELGSNASGFELLPIDVELARCYRYYETNYPISLPPGSNISSLFYDTNILMFCTVVNGGTTGSSRARSANTVLKVSKRTSSPSTRYWDYVGNLTKFTGLDNNGGTATNNVSVDTYGGVFSDGQTVYFQTVTGNASYYYGGVMWEVNSEL
jgi:hypothetical protein